MGNVGIVLQLQTAKMIAILANKVSVLPAKFFIAFGGLAGVNSEPCTGGIIVDAAIVSNNIGPTQHLLIQAQQRLEM